MIQALSWASFTNLFWKASRHLLKKFFVNFYVFFPLGFLPCLIMSENILLGTWKYIKYSPFQFGLHLMDLSFKRDSGRRRKSKENCKENKIVFDDKLSKGFLWILQKPLNANTIILEFGFSSIFHWLSAKIV